MKFSIMRWPQLSAVTVAYLVSGSGAALAHANFIETVPASQASLETPPSEIVLVFSEAVTPIVFRLIDTEGKTIAECDDSLGKSSRLSLSLRSSIPDGQYLVSYRVMSADTHPIASALGFSVGLPGTADCFEIENGAFESARVVVEAIKIRLEPRNGGEYHAEFREIVIAGEWELRIDVLVDDFTQLIYRMRVPIGE